MKASGIKTFYAIFLVFFTFGMAFAEEAALTEKNTLMNINNISFWANAGGTLGSNPYTGNWGVIFPRGTGGVIYKEGIVWGGFVNDGTAPSLRAGGQTALSGVLPGVIQSDGSAEAPNTENARIWRIREDWEAADLTNDAAEYFNIDVNSVTEEHINQLRAQYQQDWEEWPWAKGAPFYDTNGNSIMDSGEKPGIADADQVVWFAANDLDADTTQALYGSPPIGMEMQVTLWAYGDHSGKDERLQNVIYKKIRLIYKGTSTTAENAVIDSMFLGQWVDTELGHYADDFAGCDTNLQLGYGYNSTNLDEVFFNEFQIAPPAFGYTLIQGPQITTENGSENLPLSFFWHKATGSTVTDPELGTYEGTKQMYNLLNGLVPINGKPFRDMEGNNCKFMVAGDPVAATGWYDGMTSGPGDRRYMMCAGPFTMKLGDTQEIVFAMVGGHGSGYLASVDVMKWHVTYARYFYLEGLATDIRADSKNRPVNFVLNQNYPNPFNASTKISYDIPEATHLELSVYDVNGKLMTTLVNEFHHSGYHSIDFNAEHLASGVYIFRLKAGNFYETKKMILVK